MTCTGLLVIPLLSVLSVYDGDTVTVSVQPWPRVEITTSVRIDGVDTPEIRGKCDEEVHLALEARAFVERWLAEHDEVVLVDPHLGKYAGRVVGSLCSGDESLADALLEADLGRPYDGGRRESWCPDRDDP